MAVSLHHHLHAGKNRRSMPKRGEPAHEVVADSAKRLPLRSRFELDRASSALQRSMMPGDSTLELGICLSHYHPTTMFVR